MESVLISPLGFNDLIFGV